VIGSSGWGEKVGYRLSAVSFRPGYLEFHRKFHGGSRNTKDRARVFHFTRSPDGL